jgi:hypothetical protein
MTTWPETILFGDAPKETWGMIFSGLLELAQQSHSPVKLHNETIAPDRLLAESAWQLWYDYEDSAPRTSQALIDWWNGQSAGMNKAVVVLDALSLRELPIIVATAHSKGIEPVKITVTGSEVPSDTDQFAQALGSSSRSALRNKSKNESLKLNGPLYTDVMSHPFKDCVGSIPAINDILIWHTWLDDMIHINQRLPDQIYKAASEILQSDGFWDFVNRLRQGRKLIITSDHGYAVSKLFSTTLGDSTGEILRDVFGASRCVKDNGKWERKLMPPTVLSRNGRLAVMGQTKWKVQGGFPQVCHGGLSLMEVAVPFIELPPV